MESFAEFLRMFQVVLGIGLVIFVHELGHYLAARICKVRVETFSLGMGPRLIGWKPGPTQYQIALVPLGGYCRMAGEERRRDGMPPAPDELPSKSVGARFFIYSGGVVMNVVFGLVVFPILFHVGLPFVQPKLGDPVPGSPAWHARVPAGSEVLAVNGSKVLDFFDIPSEVALGNPDHTELLLRDPVSGRTFQAALTPRYEEELGISMVGITPAFDRDESGLVALEIAADSPAASAGLQSGDRLVEVIGAMPGLDELTQLSLQTLNGGAIAIRVRNADGAEREVRFTPLASKQLLPPRVGVHPPYTLLQDVRSGPETDRLDLRPADRLLSLRGTPLLRRDDLRRALFEGSGPLTFEVQRGARVFTLEAPPFSRAELLSLSDDLFVTLDVESSRVVVSPGEPAFRAGLRDGDRVLEVDGAEVGNWADLSRLVGRAAEAGRGALFSVERSAPGEEPQYRELLAQPEAQPAPIYGINLRQAEYVYRSDGLVDAVVVGTVRSWKFLQDSWLTLKRILQGKVSAEKSIGGIITIGVFSYSLAEAGWEKFFFFLCILSINLAFINVLPIPVLDGGHLFFLIVEKIKGSPVSERILGYSQMVGVVLILSLMVYVTYNDLVRWVFEP